MKLRWEIFLIGLILLGAFGLRIYKLDKNELWLDETYCTLTARKGPVGIVQELKTDNGPPLYYLLLYFWMKVAGENEVGLRALSVVFGVVAVFSIYYLGRKNFTPKVGLWAALILALSPLHIYYSQETRMYAPLVLFIILFFHYLLLLLKEDKTSYWIGFIIFSVFALYTNYAAFFFLPLALFLFFFRSKRLKQTKMLISLFIIAASFLPWVPILLSQPSAEATAWIKPYWARGKWLMLPRSLEVVFLGANYPRYLRSLPQATPLVVRIATLIPIGLIFCFAIFPWRKERLGIEQWRKILFLLLGALFLPLLLIFFLSFYRPMYVVGRHDLMVVFAAALILALGMAKLGRHWAFALIALVIYFTWGTLQANYKSPPEFFEKAAAAYILPNAGLDDTIVFTGYRRAPLEYYLNFYGGRLRHYSFPASAAQHLGWYDKAGLLEQKENLKVEGRQLARLLLEQSDPGSKVWIVYSKHRDIREGIDRYFTIEMEGLVREGAFEERQDLSHLILGLRCFERPGTPGVTRMTDDG